MPELTTDGQYKWGNVKRKTKKELAQTVYGIWKANGSKGSFKKFYHDGNPYGKSHKHVKESYQLNPLFTIKESFFQRPLFSKKPVSLQELDSIITTIKNQSLNPNFSKQYRNLSHKKYLQFKELKDLMLKKNIQECPLKIIEQISGSN